MNGPCLCYVQTYLLTCNSSGAVGIKKTTGVPALASPDKSCKLEEPSAQRMGIALTNP